MEGERGEFESVKARGSNENVLNVDEKEVGERGEFGNYGDDFGFEQDMGAHDRMIRDGDREEMMIDGEDRDGNDDDAVTEKSRRITDIILDTAVGVPLAALGQLMTGRGSFRLLPKSMQIWG